MNHPTLPTTTLATKIALVALGTGWIAFVAGAFVTVTCCLALGKLIPKRFK